MLEIISNCLYCNGRVYSGYQVISGRMSGWIGERLPILQ